MRVQIPERNTYIDFPDGMPQAEIQSAIESNWDTLAPMTKTQNISVPAQQEFIQTTPEEGWWQRVKSFVVSPDMSKEKASNIMALSESTGLSPREVLRNYDQIAGQIAEKTYPSAKDIGKTAMEVGITGGLVAHPVTTATILGVFFGLDELKNLAVSKIKGKEYQFQAGLGVSDLLEAEGLSKDAIDLSEFIAEAGVAGGVAKTGTSLFGKIVKGIVDKKQKINFINDVAKASKEQNVAPDEVVQKIVEPEVMKEPTELPPELPVAEQISGEPTITPLEPAKVAGKGKPEIITTKYTDFWNTLKGTQDEKFQQMSNIAVNYPTGKDFSEAIGELRGDPTGNWNKLGLKSARDFWRQNHRLNRKMVFDEILKDDPDFIKEESLDKVIKQTDNDIIGLKEDLHEQGYTSEEINSIIRTTEEGSAAEGLSWKFEERQAELRKELEEIPPPEGQLFKEVPFTLSGEQPFTKKEFIPPEVKGERLLEIPKATVDELAERKGERGSFNFQDTVSKTYDDLKTTGKITEMATPKEVSYFQTKLPLLNKSLKTTFAFPKTIVEKFPEKFNPIYDRTIDIFKKRDTNIYELGDTLSPYFELKDKSKVDPALIQARLEGKEFKATNEKLTSMGLSPEDIKAYRAVRYGMHESLNRLEQMYNKKSKRIKNEDDRAMYLEAVKEKIQELKDANYVPFSRYGDKYAVVLDKNGKMVEYLQAEKWSEIKKQAVDFAKQGYKIKTGKVLKTDSSMFENMPIELLSMLKNLDEGVGVELSKIVAGQMGGFPEHLLRAKMTPGFERSLEKPLADYILGISNYIAHSEARPELSSMLANIDPKKESGLFRYARDYIDYNQKVTTEGAQLRNFMFHYYLGTNVKSAMLNLSQPMTTTYPVLAKYTKSPETHFAKSMATTIKYLTNKENYTNTPLGKAIKRGVEDGIISEQMMRELSGRKGGAAFIGKTFTDYSSFLFDNVEKFNRLNAFINGYKIAEQKGMSLNESIKFAEDLVNETQFYYGKANRPEIARGKTAPLFTFRIFMGNYLKLLKDSIGQKEWGVLARMLGTMTALGGVAAIPGIKELEQALTIAGVDTKAIARESLGGGKLSDIIIHGLPTLAGMNISGAIGIGEIAPDIERGVPAALARGVMGVTADIPMRVGRAYTMATKYDDMYRAVEALMPEAIRNPMAAKRWAKEGVRTPSQEPIVEKVTTKDSIIKGLGFQPNIVTRAYERENSERLLKELTKENATNLNFRLAKALFKGDIDEYAKIINKAMDDNADKEPYQWVLPNEEAVKTYLTKMVYPGAVEIKQMPKLKRQRYIELQEIHNEER